MLGKGRNLGQLAQALGAAHAQHAHLATAQLCNGFADDVEAGGNLPGHDVLQRHGTTLVGHMHIVEAHLRGKHFAQKVHGRACTGRAKRGFVWIGLEPLHQLLQAGDAVRHHGADVGAVLQRAQRGNGHQISLRVVAELAIDMGVDGQNGAG